MVSSQQSVAVCLRSLPRVLGAEFPHCGYLQPREVIVHSASCMLPLKVLVSFLFSVFQLQMEL